MRTVSLATIRKISEALYQECVIKNGYPEYQHAIFFAVEYETSGKIMLDVKNTYESYPEVEFTNSYHPHYGLFVEGGSVILFNGTNILFKEVLSPNELKARVEATAAHHDLPVFFEKSDRGNEAELLECLRNQKKYNDINREKLADYYAQTGRLLF